MVLTSSTALPATMLAQPIDLAEASSSKLREAPLDKYRNIGIMAHIDAGEFGLWSIPFSDFVFEGFHGGHLAFYLFI